MSFRKNLIYLPALLMDMSTSSAILGTTFYAYELGASSFVVGIMASASTLCFVVFTRVFGKLSDRVSRKRVPQIACFAFSSLYLIMPICGSVRQLAILFPFTGLIISAFWPSLEAWIGSRGDRQSLGKRVRMFNLAWTGGVMLGYVTGGYIYELYVKMPFYFSGIASLFSAMVITIQPEKDDIDAQYNPQSREDDSQSIGDQKLTAKFLYLSWIANFFSWLTLGVIRYIFPKLIHDLGMSSRIFGLLMLGQAGVQALMFFILGATERWHHRIAPLAVFQILGCIGFFIIWLSNSPLLWAPALMLFGIQTGMTYFSSIYYSLHGYTDLGNKSGSHESILSSGGFFGPIIAGALAKYIDLKSPYLFCVLIIIAGLVVQSLVYRANTKDKHPVG